MTTKQAIEQAMKGKRKPMTVSEIAEAAIPLSNLRGEARIVIRRAPAATSGHEQEQREHDGAHTAPLAGPLGLERPEPDARTTPEHDPDSRTGG